MKIFHFKNSEIVSNVKKQNHALAIGNFEKVNGFDLLIKSWKNVERKLIIIGDGSDFAYLEKLIKDLDLTNKITLKKSIPHKNILHELAKAKVFIFPSREDSNSSLAIEALALKTPVLATNVGPMSSIFPNELLVEPNNQKKLQKFLEMYVDEIDLFNQKSIFEYVLEIFSIENQISQNN